MTREGTGPATDSAHLVSSLFDLIPVPVAIVDAHGSIVLANLAFNDLFPGMQSIQALPRHELELAGRGTYQLQTVPLNDEGLKIAYATEITNEVHLRRQLVHLEKMAAIGRLVSEVAHELNNPMASILGYSQLISGCELDPDIRRMAGVILGQAERAGKIVQNFLSLAAKTEPKRVLFNLNEVIQNILQLREYQQNVEDILATSDLSGDLPPAWGDPNQVEQVLLNLIINAEDAIGDADRRPGLIHIKSSVDGGRILTTISDNGSGIHASDMGRIFDPFFTTKGKQRGTGLGLSICSEIVKDHGGELYVWSTFGKGSVFTLELPIKAQVQKEEARPARTSQGQSLQGKNVLVVDDEIHITELIFDVLSRLGAGIDLVNSGAEALNQIKKKNYDVIICDQRMPGISGQRLYGVVESSNPDLRHKFLFVTGDVVNEQTKRFFVQAGVPCIRKPFKIQELVEAIEEMLSRSQPQNS